MTTTRPQSDAPPAWRWGAAAALVALGVLVAALVAGGGGTAAVVPGLSDPGVLTRWGLPIAKTILNGASALAVGFIALAVMLPAKDGELGRDALVALRVATIAALVWAAAAATVHLLTLSDLLGLPLTEALTGESLVSRKRVPMATPSAP